MSDFIMAETSGGETGRIQRILLATQAVSRFLLCALLVGICLTGGQSAWAAQGRGYTKKDQPTPTPVPDLSLIHI